MTPLITPGYRGRGYVCLLSHPATVERTEFYACSVTPLEFAKWLATKNGLNASYTVVAEVASENAGPLAAIAQLELEKVLAVEGLVSRTEAVQILGATEAFLKQSREEAAGQLVAAGDNVAQGAAPSVAALARSAELKAYAFELGDILAGYAAAEEYLSLGGSSPGQGVSPLLFTERAAMLYASTAEEGVARAWADLAVLRKYQKNYRAENSCWALYFEAMVGQKVPDEELQFLTEMLYTHYYQKNASAESLSFLRGSNLALKAGLKTFPKDYAYHQWLRHNCWTPLDRLAEKLRLPAATLLGLFLLFLASPGAALVALSSVVAFLLFWRKRKNLKNPPRT